MSRLVLLVELRTDRHTNLPTLGVYGHENGHESEESELWKNLTRELPHRVRATIGPGPWPSLLGHYLSWFYPCSCHDTWLRPLHRTPQVHRVREQLLQPQASAQNAPICPADCRARRGLPNRLRKSSPAKSLSSPILDLKSPMPWPSGIKSLWLPTSNGFSRRQQQGAGTR